MDGVLIGGREEEEEEEMGINFMITMNLKGQRHAGAIKFPGISHIQLKI